MIKMCNKI